MKDNDRKPKSMTNWDILIVLESLNYVELF